MRIIFAVILPGCGHSLLDLIHKVTSDFLHVLQKVVLFFPVQKYCKEANCKNERKIGSWVIASDGVHISTVVVVWREAVKR